YFWRWLPLLRRAAADDKKAASTGCSNPQSPQKQTALAKTKHKQDRKKMMECSYCKGAVAESDLNCPNCGAPLEPGDTSAKDFRVCPFCNRRLLALASPACNYCGRRLPEDFIKAREGDLHRVTEINDPHLGSGPLTGSSLPGTSLTGANSSSSTQP